MHLRKPHLALWLCLAAFGCLTSAVFGQYAQKFMLGTDNATTTEFEQEGAAMVDYYFENGNYTTLGGANWSGGQESLNNGVAGDATGFPRALLHPGTANTQVNIYFTLTAAQAAANQPVRLTLDLFSLKANTTHDLDVRCNAANPFAAQTGIAANQTWVITTTAGAAGMVAGPNVLRIRRTGGQIDAGSAWIQFDYLKLEIDPSPQFIQSFTSSDLLVRPGESSSLAWTLLEPTATVSIAPGIGDVTGLTVGGQGSIPVNPATDTTYTLTATFNAQVQTRTVTVKTSPWFAVWELGLDDGTHADFSHEVAADDHYYFAGDYTSVGGPNQAANESLNDDTDTNTVPGRTGNPAIGFERALTDTDPTTTVWFIATPTVADPTRRLQVNVELLNMSGPGGSSSHDLEFSINDNVVRRDAGVNSARVIRFETTAISAGLVAGPNKFTIRRTGGTITSYVTFDFVWLEHLPGTAPTVTGVTFDHTLGTRTVG